MAAERERLPVDRVGSTHKFAIRAVSGTVKAYITVNTYPDGRVAEIFLKGDKMGDAVSGLLDGWATMASLALQYGVPLEVLLDKARHMRFEPSGRTGNPEIPVALSLLDYVARWLGLRFCGTAGDSRSPVDGQGEQT